MPQRTTKLEIYMNRHGGAARIAPQAPARHKHGVGAAVTLIGRSGDIRSRDMDREFEAGRFEVVRLLPAEGPSLQYRIKNLTTGRERVVAEEQIAPFTGEAQP